jgi:hypothetical protein
VAFVGLEHGGAAFDPVAAIKIVDVAKVATLIFVS